jgi:hypothetical protein
MSNTNKLFAIASAAIATIFLSTSVHAERVTIGNIEGNFNATVTSGLTVRAAKRKCEDLPGFIRGANTLGSLLNGGNVVALGMQTGNGGCSRTATDSFGNTSTGTYNFLSENGDDANLNYDNGEIVDATSTLSGEFMGSSNDVDFNLSFITSYNPINDLNAPSFKPFTNKARDEIETKFAINNAYISGSADISEDNYVDWSIGRYVDSQGATLFLPIGNNVRNAIDLSVLRAPGASIKDALLPQAMIGMNTNIQDVSVGFTYQVEQREVILDPAGSFYGSELVGTGETGLLKTSNDMEAMMTPASGLFYGDTRYVLSECDQTGTAFNAVGQAAAQTFGALATTLASVGCSGTADLRVHGVNDMETLVNNYFVTNVAGSLGVQQAAGAGILGSSLAAIANGVADGTLAVFSAGVTTDDGGLMTANSGNGRGFAQGDFLTGLATLAANARDVTTRRASLHLRKAPDANARDDGQFGLQFSGYEDSMMGGMDWGIYFNRYHSNSPYVRILPITGLNSIDMWTTMQGAGFDAQLPGSDSANNWGVAIANEFAHGSATLCNLVAGGLNPADTTSMYAASYDADGFNDPEKCRRIYLAARDLADAADNGAVDGSAGTDFSTVMAATASDVLATLFPADNALYQVYYPEDIDVFGASLNGVVGNGIALGLELAYRPDFPLQFNASDQVNNLFDTTGAAQLQTFATMKQASAGAAGQAAIAAYSNYLSSYEWSNITNCDISSTTGTASTVAGYSECAGHTEMDVWTLDVNTISSFAPSHEFPSAFKADGASLIFEVGAVFVPDMTEDRGIISSGQHSFGAGGSTCNPGFGQSNGLGGTIGTDLAAFSSNQNAILGNGLCGNDAGASELAATYRIRSSVNYNNVNNTPWSISPSFGLDHDFMGNAPSSIGGFTEDRMKLSLGVDFTNAEWKAGLNYTNQLGDRTVNGRTNLDTVSASVSYAF